MLTFFATTLNSDINKNVDVMSDVYNASNFINSIDYSANKRSAGSEYKFNYSGTLIQISANTTLASTFPAYSQIIVYVNGLYNQTVNIVDSSTIYNINLPSGNKEIKLIEGLTSKPSSTIIGVWLSSIMLQASKYSLITEGNINERIVFLGDSITVGGNATYPTKDGYAFLFKQNKEVAVVGYGYGKIKDFAETTIKINTTVGYFNSLFSNVTTTKKIVISLGTNDFALDGTSAATFSMWYGNLLNAINSADNTIDVFCISPLNRTSNNALLDSYRTEIQNLCSIRSYCTYIDGKPILDTTIDLVDGVHPSTSGHLKYYNAIKNTIN